MTVLFRVSRTGHLVVFALIVGIAWLEVKWSMITSAVNIVATKLYAFTLSDFIHPAILWVVVVVGLVVFLQLLPAGVRNSAHTRDHSA